MTKLITKENITDYIPQRPPVVMIDEVLTCKEDEIVSQFEITEENIFLFGQKFSESGLVENIAQTAAAKVGYECHLKQVPVPLGFIGAVSKIAVSKLPSIGDTIRTKITIKDDIMGVTLIHGASEVEGKQLISCEMKIVIQ